jgi:hypothetical protein
MCILLLQSLAVLAVRVQVLSRKRWRRLDRRDLSGKSGGGDDRHPVTHPGRTFTCGVAKRCAQRTSRQGSPSLQRTRQGYAG